MTVSEEAVLEFKDPSIKDWDDWPTYTLRKVKVFSQKTGEPGSLLTAHKDHRVRVLGQLDTIDADQSHLSNEGSHPLCLLGAVADRVKSVTKGTETR